MSVCRRVPVMHDLGSFGGTPIFLEFLCKRIKTTNGASELFEKCTILIPFDVQFIYVRVFKRNIVYNVLFRAST